jgi:hypothetical protein
VKKAALLQAMTALALAGGLLAASVPACAQGGKGPFVMSADQDEKTFAGKWVWLIYTEAFKRLGMTFQLSANPMTRQSALADDGLVDGEVARVYSYADTHPNLVRVEEPVLDLVFSLYTAVPTLHPQRIEDMKEGNWHGEYRRGVGVCENALKQVFAADRLSDVTTSEQGAKKLIAGHTDVYCDNEVSMARVLHSPEVKGVDAIRKVLSIGNAIPTYPYLYKKHADLAPRLAATLKKMKDEGLIEAYRLQAERDMGWRK